MHTDIPVSNSIERLIKKNAIQSTTVKEKPLGSAWIELDSQPSIAPASAESHFRLSRTSWTLLRRTSRPYLTVSPSVRPQRKESSLDKEKPSPFKLFSTGPRTLGVQMRPQQLQVWKISRSRLSFWLLPVAKKYRKNKLRIQKQSSRKHHPVPWKGKEPGMNGSRCLKTTFCLPMVLMECP